MLAYKKGLLSLKMELIKTVTTAMFHFECWAANATSGAIFQCLQFIHSHWGTLDFEYL